MKAMENILEQIKITGRKPAEAGRELEPFTLEAAEKVRAFHGSFPQYGVTELHQLPHLAAALKVKNIYVKDESTRFGLNAFKVLGGSYAIACELAKRFGLGGEPDYKTLLHEAMKHKDERITFVTATDGNHGRGVAWTAAHLGCRSVVFMPKGTAAERLENIRKLGAEASITELNYDDAVRHARSCGEKYGWTLVQDTSWEGYEEIPLHIMQGYMTMACEAVLQLEETKPTHVFLQAGVGSMAGAAAAFLKNYYGARCPQIIIVEPDKADCLYKTAAADDGRLHFAQGPLDSIMAGLCCGEPCSLGWEILKRHASHFISMPDWVAACGMRILAAPLPGDGRIVSGESGAAGFGLAAAALRLPELEPLKRRLGLGEDSVILCFSTEGATDRANYRRILWDGAWPLPDAYK